MRGLLIIVITGLLSVEARQAGAFPGQTAEELIRALGPSANGYASPPVPSVDAVRTGRAQLSQVYWPQAAYDPLGAGAALQGIVVTTFDYEGTGLLDRLQKDPPQIGWKDLVSRSEVFLSFLSPKAFQRLLAEIDAGWQITSRTHHGSGTGYDLYTLVSRDGRLQGEMSYAEKGEVPPPPDPSGQQPPTLNFWTKISVVR
jgi:hypothetical protein